MHIIHLFFFKGGNQLVLEFEKPIPGGEPVYLQIVRQFKLAVLQGRLKNGDEVPSRRMLAAQLAVNPNTVQKAFAELENDGLINTPPNAKSVVYADETVFASLREELLEGQISALVTAAKGTGISRGQFVTMICADWDRNNREVENETVSDATKA